MRSVRYSVRSLLKTPGFTVIALLTLALGIGVNTAMFSLVDTLLFKSAPYPEPDRLVRIFRTSQHSQTWPHSPPEIADLKNEITSFAAFSGFAWANYSLAEAGQPAERIPGLNVGADFFAVLRVQPALGRAFSADEFTTGRNGVIVLSHALWQRRFASDPTIVGRPLRIDGENVTVVGVMPAGVEYPLLWGRVDAWRPAVFSKEEANDRGRHWLSAIARLKPERTIEAAPAECATVVARWIKDFPAISVSTGLRLVVLHRSTMDAVGRSISAMVMGLAGFVLLIACANLANLQLARTRARVRDFAIRSALGASRGQVMRELLIESLVLATAGGALGLLLAMWVTDALSRRVVISDGTSLTVSLDWSVLGFALCASLITGVVFGLLPAWTAARSDVNATLKQQARGSTGDRAHLRWRDALIVGEVALALALLTGAGFFVRGLQRFTARDLGWSGDHVLTATVALPASTYQTDEQKRAFYARAVERLSALPGVEHAALATSLPIWVFNNSRDVVPEGKPQPPLEQIPISYYVSVTPEYFAALRMHLVRGQLLPKDVRADSPPVVVINETMAQRFWPGEDPIGKRIGPSGDDNKEWHHVVGVVRDVGFGASLTAPESRLQVYRPLVQDPWSHLTIVLRTAGEPGALSESVRQAIADVDHDVPAYNIRTVAESIDRLSSNFRLSNNLFLGFALLGLVLAAVGLYGVISGLVVQRTSEFGIRLALGAQTGTVLWLVLRKGLQLAGTGIALGLLGSAALLRVCAAAVPALPAIEFGLVAGASGVLLIVALLASWFPARRATRVDPIIALRAE